MHDRRASNGLGARLFLHESEQGFPQAPAAIRAAFREALQLGLVRTQRHTEHVGDHLVAQPLFFEGVDQIQKYLIGGVGQLGATATAGRQLGDQHRGLANDGVDQQPRFHVSVLPAWFRAR